MPPSCKRQARCQKATLFPHPGSLLGDQGLSKHRVFLVTRRLLDYHWAPPVPQAVLWLKAIWTKKGINWTFAGKNQGAVPLEVSSPSSLTHSALTATHRISTVGLDQESLFVSPPSVYPKRLWLCWIIPSSPFPCNQGQSTEPLLWAVLSALGMRPWK